MKIKRQHLFHGAVLAQLAEHRSLRTFNKLGKKYGHYQLNDACRLMIKLAAGKSGPWKFWFRSGDLNTLSSDVESGFETFVVLVCGRNTICLLSRLDFRALIHMNSTAVQWISVDVEDPRMRVCGSRGALKHTVAHNSFPNKVFAKRRKPRRERLS